MKSKISKTYVTLNNIKFKICNIRNLTQSIILSKHIYTIAILGTNKMNKHETTKS